MAETTDWAIKAELQYLPLHWAAPSLSARAEFAIDVLVSRGLAEVRWPMNLTMATETGIKATQAHIQLTGEWRSPEAVAEISVRVAPTDWFHTDAAGRSRFLGKVSIKHVDCEQIRATVLGEIAKSLLASGDIEGALSMTVFPQPLRIADVSPGIRQRAPEVGIGRCHEPWGTAGNAKADVESGQAAEFAPDVPTGFLGGVELANALGVDPSRYGSFVAQLGRKRIELGDDSWHEVRDPRRNKPRFLYRVDSPNILRLAAVYKRAKLA